MFLHRTCLHGYQAIRKSGVVRPNMHPFLGVPVSWWTDAEWATREDLGLSMRYITCDRMKFSFMPLSTLGLEPWTRFAHRKKIPSAIRMPLEAGAMPAHWFVAEVDVPVLIDTPDVLQVEMER